MSNTKDSLVAINLLINGTLENKNGVPLLYYWDGSSDLNIQLKNDEDFIRYIAGSSFNVDTYSKSRLTYFYFNYDNGDENYNEYFDDIQNWITLEEIEKTGNNFYLEYFKYYFNYLYKCAFKKAYEFTNEIIPCINDIYDKIKDKYPEKIIKNTVVNYIHSELCKTNNLSEVNINYLIEKLKNILKDKD